jgi:hypothetical protein
MDTNNHSVVLLDFDNYFKREIDHYSEMEIEFEISKIIKEILIKAPETDKISVRLYAGWYEEEQLTKKASQAMQIFSNISIFPILVESEKKIIHGDIEFVTELLQVPKFTWYYTFKEKPGIPNLRINKDNLNPNCEKFRDQCPAYILSNFTKAKSKFCKVPGCNNRQKDVFYSRGQKMIDTIIACDIISLFENSEYNSIFLVSEDIDHLPALAFGSTRNNIKKNIYLCINNQQIQQVINSIVSNFDIKILVMP